MALEGLFFFYVLERSLRVPARPCCLAPLWPIVVKLLYYRDWDHILNQASLWGDIMVDNHRIMLFPDFTREVQKQRPSFVDVKKHLRQLGLRYDMMFPARPRATTGDTCTSSHERNHFGNGMVASLSKGGMLPQGRRELSDGVL